MNTLSRNNAGYSLIELTIAMGILLAGISAAASLAMNTAQIEDINYRKARVLAISEGAARMWQLGLSAELTRTLLLGDPALAALTINANAGDALTAVPSNKDQAVTDPSADLGVFDQATIRATVHSFEGDTDGANSATTPVNPIVVIR